MPELFPPLLFASVGLLCGLLALLEAKARRRSAWFSAIIALFSALCFVSNHAWARYAIRIDLLLTIPLVSLAGLIAGVRAMLRPPAAARVIGALLAVGGGIAFGWYTWAIARSSAENARAAAAFDEGRRLYWNETIRCEANFEKRFGPLRHSTQPCSGNLVVTARSAVAYPFTRVIVNDRREVYLLFSPQLGMEDNSGLRDGFLALLAPEPDGGLSGEGDLGLGRTRVDLRPAASGRCEARVTRRENVSALSLTRTQLPECEATINPPVRYAGAWGKIIADPAPSRARRLVQLWLWEVAGQARGVLAEDLALSGMRRDFAFLRHFHGTRRGANEWDLRFDEPQGSGGDGLLLARREGHARLKGPEILVGHGGEAILEPGERISDPRRTLVPVRDRALFEIYLDDALFNTPMSWTAP